jgi:hypothetical protein
MSAKIPKNIRFRQDQIDGLAEMETAETDFSALVRTAVDDLLAKRRNARVKEEPAAKYSATRTKRRK